MEISYGDMAVLLCVLAILCRWCFGVEKRGKTFLCFTPFLPCSVQGKMPNVTPFLHRRQFFSHQAFYHGFTPFLVLCPLQFPRFTLRVKQPFLHKWFVARLPDGGQRQSDTNHG